MEAKKDGSGEKIHDNLSGLERATIAFGVSKLFRHRFL